MQFDTLLTQRAKPRQFVLTIKQNSVWMSPQHQCDCTVQGYLRFFPPQFSVFESYFKRDTGVSILMSYGVNPHYVKLPIFSEFMENSAKFMKNSGLTKWTQNLR